MRLIVTGGGTGGHLFPAIAVAEALVQRTGGRVLFAGTARQIDNRVLSGQGFERRTITFSGVKGLGIAGMAGALVRLPVALMQSLRMIRQFRPDLVFGVGGYVTVPVLLAAKILRVPICIHEQNSVPGLANRVAGRLADRICLSLPCASGFAEERSVLTGNPVRKEILAAAADREKRKKDPGATPTLLVLGGSQGAQRVNSLMVEAAGKLAEKNIPFQLVHQTGRSDEAMVRQAYLEAGIRAEVSDFFTDMAGVYSTADLVISRAGATTLAELAVMGLPALLIPYPHAADDHQTTNAAHYVRAGGARAFEEAWLDGQTLADELAGLLDNCEALADMARGMRSRALPGATESIVALCLELVNGETPETQEQAHVQ